MNRRIPTAAAALLLMGGGAPAMATTQWGEHLSFSGFGTLGAVQTNSDEGKFGKDRQYKGGAEKSANFDVDSNLGLQVIGTATPWLSATVQVLASKRDKGHVEAEVEWAFVSVKPLESLSLRAGRMAAPVFAISDSRNIGYANTWVRAPNEVYALNVFRRMEGLDLTYSTHLGPFGVSATGFGGKTEFRALGNAQATGESLKGLNLQLESDWVNIRIGRMQTKVVIPTLGETGDPYTFSGLGVTVDRDNVVAQAEYVTRRSDKRGDATNADSWYVMGGYRIGKLLPYLIRSSTKPEKPNTPILVSAVQETTAAGLRWDAFSSAAIKFQVDRIDTQKSRGISFYTPSTPPVFPGGPPGAKPVTKPVTAISMAVDFTF